MIIATASNEIIGTVGMLRSVSGEAVDVVAVSGALVDRGCRAVLAGALIADFMDTNPYVCHARAACCLTIF
jgi:hypothetical protein